jgi:predicted metal-dependent hydrolase
MNDLRYLTAYPADLQAQARRLLDERKLGDYICKRYPGQHDIQSDKALYQYVVDIKQEHMRNAPPIDRVRYDSKLDVIHNALGLHTRQSRQHGNKLKASKEIRIATLFRDTPPEFLRMIAVHELAHLREMEHNKAFYQLCEHMQPGYHQLEFDLRLYLTWREQEKG